MTFHVFCLHFPVWCPYVALSSDFAAIPVQYLLHFPKNRRQVASIETSAISQRQIPHKSPLVYTHLQFYLELERDKNCTKNRTFKRALRSAKCGSGRKDKAG